MTKTILLEPNYEIGAEVKSIVTPERHYVVIGYRIEAVSNAGTVTFFYYLCSDADNALFHFRDCEIEPLD